MHHSQQCLSHFLVAIVGALIAAVGTGVLVSRCLRAPNAVLVAWTVAIFGLTVSLAAQAVGYELGFGPIAFRAMEIGAQVLAPLALAFGLTELAGKTIISRFAARLILTAVAIVALVILGHRPAGRGGVHQGLARRPRSTTRSSRTSCSSSCWPRSPRSSRWSRWR